MSTGISSLIKNLGGATRVAEALDASVKTVSAWATRGSIPVDHWPKIIQLAAEKGLSGITADALLDMHAPSEQAA